MEFLFKKIDNAPLILFRIIFGLVLTLEAWGSLFTGWIHTTYIEPSMHFSAISFEWLQPLDGFGMYYLYAFMGFLGLGVILGYFYKVSIIGYTVLWTYCYLSHKIAYNNHYYLMILLCFIMCLLPAHRYFSLDVKYRNIKQHNNMLAWMKYLLIFQITCVYVFGGIAKIYPDWLDGTFPKMLLQTKASFPVIGQYFTKKWFYMGIAYGGLLFDLCIIPLLSYKRTRLFGFLLSLIFHSFNSIVFQVGVFPYLSISFALFFYSDQFIQKWFFPKKNYYKPSQKDLSKNNTTVILLSLYVILQLFLPLRQYFIQGTPFWTEEAHKMSWRMMLRSNSGATFFKIVDDKTTTIHKVKNLSPSQKRLINTNPSVIWQYAQVLKTEAAQKGKNIQVYAISRKSLNGRPMQEFIDPTVDLANTKWKYFAHQPWIRPFKGW